MRSSRPTSRSTGPAPGSPRPPATRPASRASPARDRPGRGRPAAAPERRAAPARRAVAGGAKRSPRGRIRPTALLVAASVGPYGAMLADGSEYRGDYGLTVAELRRWHAPRLAALADAGADLLAIETIPTLDEGRALVELLRRDRGPAGLAQLHLRRRGDDPVRRAGRGGLRPGRGDRPDRRRRRELHRARARPAELVERARRGDDQADRRLSEQRRELGCVDPALDGCRRAGRRRDAARAGSRRRQPDRRLLPGRSGSDRRAGEHRRAASAPRLTGPFRRDGVRTARRVVRTIRTKLVKWLQRPDVARLAGIDRPDRDPLEPVAGPDAGRDHLDLVLEARTRGRRRPPRSGDGSGVDSRIGCRGCPGRPPTTSPARRAGWTAAGPAASDRSRADR